MVLLGKYLQTCQWSVSNKISHEFSGIYVPVQNSDNKKLINIDHGKRCRFHALTFNVSKWWKIQCFCQNMVSLEMFYAEVVNITNSALMFPFMIPSANSVLQ